MLKLSIILPVYNVEDYLEKCIMSLQSQDLSRDEFEVIIIDDGSTDRSKEVAKAMQTMYGNVLVFDQENMGVSEARNSGVRRAKGRYILFVDPDDFFDSGCLGELYESAASNQYDVLMVGIKEVQLSGTITFLNIQQQSVSRLSGIQLYNCCRQARGASAIDAAYGMLIRRQFVLEHGLFFLKDVPFLEDGEFIARLFCLAEKCGYISSPYYNRVIRPGSATHSKLFFTNAALYGFVKSARNLKTFQKSPGLRPEQRIFLNQPIIKFVTLCLQTKVGPRRSVEPKNVRGLLASQGLQRVEVTGCRNPYFTFGVLYNLSSCLLLAFLWLRAAAASLKWRLIYARLSDVS